KELHETQNEAMDALDARMTALMKKYGQVVNPNDYEPIPFSVKPEEAADTYARLMETAELQLKVLSGLKIPRLFVGVTPFLAFAALCGLAGFGGQIYSGNLTTPAIKEILMSAG